MQAAARGVPRNAHTGRTYRGINIALLWDEATTRGYPTNLWLTYKQSVRIGAHVRRGERGVLCAYVEPEGREEQSSERGGVAPAEGGGGDSQGRGGTDVSDRSEKWDDPEGAHGMSTHGPACRPFWLFNAAQIDGLPRGCLGHADPRNVSEAGRRGTGCAADAVERALRIIGGCDVTVRHGVERATYLPNLDEVHLPIPQKFTNAASYCAALLRSLVHWSGHPARQARRGVGSSNAEDAALEGLVADLGAALLVADCELEGVSMDGDGSLPAARARHAALIDLLQRDCTVIFTAAQRAQEAFDFIVAHAMPEIKRLGS